jgi:peptide/nickel transport system substrate-binding protein
VPDLPILRTSATNGGGGVNRIIELIHGGLGRLDSEGKVHPQLAEAVPSLENGLWVVSPDGRMQTTWKIRPDARWHDGTAVTADDFVFGAVVEQDKEIPWRVDTGFQSVQSIDAPDPATVVVNWNKTYIFADVMTSMPERLVPKHLLQQAYEQNKGTFLDQPYWSTSFVGAGPYRLKEIVHGSYVLLQAFDGYALGRPKIDEIEVKFIPGSTTLVANLLANSVDLTLGLTLSPDEAVNLRNQWQDGTVYVSPEYASTVGIATQFINPTPSVVGNLQFRRAVAHAADRQALVDSIQAGLSEVAHSFISVPLQGIESRVVKYEYDPRLAAQMIEELGYRKGGSGFYEDGAGQRLTVPFWAVQEEQERAKAMLAVAEDWKRLGIDAQPYLVPAQQQDAEFLATYPAFFVRGIGGGEDVMALWLKGSSAPRAENGFRGNNRSRYVNAEFDALIDRFYVTLSQGERRQALGDVIHHLTDQVAGIGLFYNVDISMLNKRLVNVTPSTHFARGWDAHLWDVK